MLCVPGIFKQQKFAFWQYKIWLFVLEKKSKTLNEFRLFVPKLHQSHTSSNTEHLQLRLTSSLLINTVDGAELQHYLQLC